MLWVATLAQHARFGAGASGPESGALQLHNMSFRAVDKQPGLP